MLYFKMISMGVLEILSNTSFLNTESNTVLHQEIKASDFENEIRDNTQGIYIETPSNPTLKIIDLESISMLAKKAGIWTMIDNTFASPVNQNPIAFGIDVVLHSANEVFGRSQ